MPIAMQVILAIDSFKGCLTSSEIEGLFSKIWREKGVETVALPMSDGGEGMLEAFTAALQGQYVTACVQDPLGRKRMARYSITPDGTAVIETAQACGLALMSEQERNPIKATTYGVGELVVDAVRHGCRKFIIGLGGSGTSDAGRGMLHALAEQLTDSGKIEDLVHCAGLKGCQFMLASDVRNPLYGPEGAARVFGPQKGATPEMVELLDRQAREFAAFSSELLGIDNAFTPGAGAAGGLGYAFIQYLQATVQSGADLLLDWIGFDEIIRNAAVIITGEGHADRQSLMGKLPERVLQRAQKHAVPVWLVAGQVSDSEILERAGFQRVDSLTPEGMEIAEAVRPQTVERNIRNWVAQRTSQLDGLLAQVRIGKDGGADE